MAAPADPLLLLELRDIHPPAAAAPWPPAPGWWLLAGLLLISVVVGLLLWYRRGALRRAARIELGKIHERFVNHGESARLALELSMLLRRVALARFPRREVASLHGGEWLGFLDRHGGDGAFSRGPGRVLGAAPYQPSAGCDAEQLLRLAARWLEKNA